MAIVSGENGTCKDVQMTGILRIWPFCNGSSRPEKPKSPNVTKTTTIRIPDACTWIPSKMVSGTLASLAVAGMNVASNLGRRKT